MGSLLEDILRAAAGHLAESSEPEGESEKLKVKVAQSCPTLLRPHGLYGPWNSPGQNAGVGSPSLLQGIFPTQGSNPELLQKN